MSKKNKTSLRHSQTPTLVDLFAGCGGLSLGLERAGFRPVFVSEINNHALDSYLINRKHLGLKRDRDTCNDIVSLVSNKVALTKLSQRIRKEHGDITIVAGGPPCQGFSRRGIRTTFSGFQRVEIPSNHLYKCMADFISVVAPKVFLFENVAGLLTARWSQDGEPGEIWNDVLRTFGNVKCSVSGRRLHYRIHHTTKPIRSSDYGVPQNRPRVFIIGVRSDIDFKSDLSQIAGGLFPDPSGLVAPDPVDLLSDLCDPRWKTKASTDTYPSEPKNAVQRRLRRRNQNSNHIFHKGAPLSEHVYSRHSSVVSERFRYLIKDPDNLPNRLRNKKFAQRALPKRWGSRGPSITATSCSEDYVHYSQPRILTVREWARLQMFPDWYQFSGPRTTGGRRRAGDPSRGLWDRDLPKYTQIGNAVPVTLAEQIGRHLVKVLSLP